MTTKSVDFGSKQIGIMCLELQEKAKKLQKCTTTKEMSLIEIKFEFLGRKL